MWAEKVDRSRSMFCSSPTSVKTLLKYGRRAPSATGTSIPLCAIRALSPRVLRATVFPPVLGPVITRARLSGGRRTSIGVTGRPVKRRPGCRALRSSIAPSEKIGRVHSYSTAKRGASHGAVNLAQAIDTEIDLLGDFAYQRGEVGEDLANDRLFVADSAEQIVVELDGEQRLDEECLPGDGTILHDALHARGRGGLHRYDKAVVANRHVLVGDDVRHAAPCHQIAEPSGQSVSQLANTRANLGQLFGCLVQQAAVVVEGSSQSFGERGESSAGRRSGAGGRPCLFRACQRRSGTGVGIRGRLESRRGTRRSGRSRRAERSANGGVPLGRRSAAGRRGDRG